MNYYYKTIKNLYKGKYAKRSGLPYINHIDEGIKILEHFNAPRNAVNGFILHPIFQGDVDLKYIINSKEELEQLLDRMNPYLIMCVMEYRNKANAYLSKDYETGNPSLSPIEEVNWMLLADKIQNYKDFLKHQTYEGNNPTMTEDKWNKLDGYFQEWLAFLAHHFEMSFNKEIEEVWKIIQ